MVPRREVSDFTRAVPSPADVIRRADKISKQLGWRYATPARASNEEPFYRRFVAWAIQQEPGAPATGLQSTWARQRHSGHRCRVRLQGVAVGAMH
jgi:hypothetical protein